MGSKKKEPRLRVDDAINEEWRNSGQQRDQYSSDVRGALGPERDNAQTAYDMALRSYGDAAGASLNPESRRTFGDYSSGAFLDPEARRRLRGNGVYDEFSQTGGWDAGRRADYQGQIAAQTPAIYQGVQQNLNRMNAVQGGYSPGFSAQSRVVTRDGARAGAEAVQKGNIAMNEQIDQGRQWGTSGMTSSENALQQILNQGRQWGAGSLAESDLETARTRMAGAEGLRGLRSDTPGYFSLFDDILGGDTAYGNRREGLIGQQGNEDTRRWDRKGKVARAAGGALKAVPMPGAPTPIQ